jgi:branched-chain amino acid transport system permease protein
MILQQLINGITLGSIYSLVGISFTLLIGVLHLLNFALGEVMMLGALIAWAVVTLTGLNMAVAIPVVIVATTLLGVIMDLTAFRPLRRREEYYLAPIISSIGFSLIFQELATKFTGGVPVSFPESIVQGKIFHIGSAVFSSINAMVLGIALAMMVLLHCFLQKTRLGIAVRATSESFRISRLLGINTNHIILVVSGIASMLSGISGVLVGLTYGAVSPALGTVFINKGFVVMLLGGFGSVYGAMIAGILFGLIEILSASYLSTTYKDLWTFVLLIIVLLFRPLGLFGNLPPVHRGD